MTLVLGRFGSSSLVGWLILVLNLSVLMRYLFAKKRNAMNERKRISHQKEEADECSHFGDHWITVVNTHTPTQTDTRLFQKLRRGF